MIFGVIFFYGAGEQQPAASPSRPHNDKGKRPMPYSVSLVLDDFVGCVSVPSMVKVG